VLDAFPVEVSAIVGCSFRWYRLADPGIGQSVSCDVIKNTQNW
jgi:hypothetical protein